jgi:hypothetical protein
MYENKGVFLTLQSTSINLQNISRPLWMAEKWEITKRMMWEKRFEPSVQYFDRITGIKYDGQSFMRTSRKSFCSSTIFKWSFQDLEQVTCSRRKTYLQHVTYFILNEDGCK